MRRMLFGLTLAVSAAVALATCSDPTGPGAPMLRLLGTVTGPAGPDAAPVPGAEVTVNVLVPGGHGVWATDSTDGDGAYALDLDVADCPADSLPALVQVEAPGYRTATLGTLAGGLRLPCDGARTLDIVLRAEGEPGTRVIRVAGTVTAAGGDPVADARVMLSALLGPDDADYWASDLTATDPAGRYALRLEAPGTCTAADTVPALVRVEARDFRTYTAGSELGTLGVSCDSAVQTLDLTLARSVFRTPQPVAGDLAPTALAVAAAHACAITGTGTWCWGDGAFGRLGTPVDGVALTPVRVGGGHGFEGVAAGADHSCGTDADSLAWCWGRNDDGELGVTRGLAATPDPQRVTGIQGVGQVVVGVYHSCGLTPRDAYCWGDGRALGADLQPGEYPPRPVTVHLPGRAVSLSAEHGHTCALLDTGELWCWGVSEAGELGSGETPDDYLSPIGVAGDLAWAAVDAGPRLTCALTVDGAAYCWGDDAAGRLGTGADIEAGATPQPVAGGHTFTAISAGATHACAVDAEGVAWCWGENETGALGVAYDAGGRCEGVACVPEPVAVDTDLRFTAIGAGAGYSCGITTAGTLVCWGKRDLMGIG